MYGSQRDHEGRRKNGYGAPRRAYRTHRRVIRPSRGRRAAGRDRTRSTDLEDRPGWVPGLVHLGRFASHLGGGCFPRLVPRKAASIASGESQGF
jgi:hypothetical protein